MRFPVNKTVLIEVAPAYCEDYGRLNNAGAVVINNLTDERAQYSHEWGIYEFGQGNLAEGRSNVARIYTNRPREMGIRFIKHFGDG